VKQRSHKVVWIEKGWQPHHIGFCPSRKAWEAMCKRFHVTDPYPPDENKNADAFCSVFEHSKYTSRCSVITVNKRIDKDFQTDKHFGNALGVILHECVHAYQDMLTGMGEKKPGSEFEAYSVQYIFLQVMRAYTKTRGKGHI